MSRYLTVAAIAAAAVVTGTGAANAQSYDAAFFARLQPGTAVEGRAGCTWAWSQQSNVAPGWGGWYQQCSSPTPQQQETVTPTSTVTEADCDGHIDVYAEGDKALACALLKLRNQAPADRPTFQVGQKYVAGYDAVQMVVLGLARDVIGNEVVVYQWLTDTTSAKAGDVGAFINGSAASDSWRKVQ
jgi:hypothetical protein